jgi:hypothetical protein
MVFADNKRVLLGDYILECFPGIDSCEHTDLVPVEYPREIVDDPATLFHWSEIIIAPDNEHIAWTILRSDHGGAAAMIGKLIRQKDSYRVADARIISSLESLKKDPDRPGFFIPQPSLGGEVKQFVHGGRAISLVGSKDSVITDSVVQDLAVLKTERITKTPGYDETTIFSPDERLGIVMTTRGSPKTNPAVFGLLPRPHCYAMQGMIQIFYLYAVAGVRTFRPGNIGPAIIDIERSIHEEGYNGVLLNDPEEQWVYYSPMSWHPSSKKAMWPEGLRLSLGDGKEAKMRIRIAELLDYSPGAPVPAGKTPEHIPYAETDLSKLLRTGTDGADIEGKIAGRHSGHIRLRWRLKGTLADTAGTVEETYSNFSDDGKTFYNGYEKSSFSIREGSVYEADLTMSGAETGVMKLRVAFSKVAGFEPPKLLFEKTEDGKPKSYGYASYRGRTLNIEDMLE